MTPEEERLQLRLWALEPGPALRAEPDPAPPPAPKRSHHAPKPRDLFDTLGLSEAEARQRARIEAADKTSPARCGACLTPEVEREDGKVRLCGRCSGALVRGGLIAQRITQPELRRGPGSGGLLRAIRQGRRVCSFCHCLPTRGLDTALPGADAYGEGGVPVVACPACLRSLRRCLGLAPPRA